MLKTLPRLPISFWVKAKALKMTQKWQRLCPRASSPILFHSAPATSAPASVASLLLHKCARYTSIFGFCTSFPSAWNAFLPESVWNAFNLYADVTSSKRPSMIALNKSCLSVSNSTPLPLQHPTRHADSVISLWKESSLVEADVI